MAEEIFLDLDLGPQFGRLKFKSFDELQSWHIEESKVWDWLIPVLNSDGNLHNGLHQGQVGFRNALNNLITNFSQNPHGNKVEIGNVFRTWISSGRAFSSGSPGGKFILELRKSSPISAAWALVALTAQSNAINISALSTPALDGVMLAILWRNGIKGTARSEKAALEDLFKQASNSQAEFKTRSEDLDSLAIGYQEKGEKIIEAFGKDAKDTLVESQKKFEEAVVAGKAQLDLIANVYEANLALQAPVLYWKKKARKHFWVLVGLVVAVLLGMGLSVWGLVVEVKAPMPSIEPGKWPEPWKLGLLLISLTMFIWVIRVMMKVMLSQLHLHADADERSVMTNAYLALLKRGKAMRDEDRELILAVLFRPSATGIVDDGGPATPTELLTRVIQGRGNS